METTIIYIAALSLLAGGSIFIAAIICFFTKSEQNIKAPIMGSIFLILYSASILYVDHQSYKQGQIDAQTGKKIYELRTNPDSTKTWQQVEKRIIQ